MAILKRSGRGTNTHDFEILCVDRRVGVASIQKLPPRYLSQNPGMKRWMAGFDFGEAPFGDGRRGFDTAREARDWLKGIARRRVCPNAIYVARLFPRGR